MQKNSLTGLHSTSKLPACVETVSVYDFIEEVKSNAENKVVMMAGSRKYFGEVTFCVHEGQITHVKKYETIK